MPVSIPSRHSGLAHAGGLIFCLLLGFSVWYVGAVLHGAGGWADSVTYIIVGKHIALEGHFPPAPPSYEAFMASGAAVFSSQPPYALPNLAFAAAIGLIGRAMGEYTLLCGLILNLGFSLLFAASAYLAGASLFRDRIMALVFTITLLMYRHIFVLLGVPLTDLSLLIFCLLSAWAMLQERTAAAGILLGIGFLFREQALLFYPLLPLLHPDVLSVKSYLRVFLKLSLGFLPCFFLAKGANVLFSTGMPAEDFYAAHIAKRISFSSERLSRFLSHAGAIFRVAWAPLVVFLYFLLRRQAPAASTRLAAVGIIHNLAVAFLWSHKPLPQRYYAYSIILFFIAALLPMMTLRHKRAALAAFFVLVAASQGQYITSKLRDFSKAENTMAATIEDIRSPLEMRRVFPKGSVIFSKDEFLAEYAAEGMLPVMGVEYDEFVERNNEAFDGIMVRTDWRGWADRPQVRDKYGVTFKKLELPGVRLSPELLFYIRVR